VSLERAQEIEFNGGHAGQHKPRPAAEAVPYLTITDVVARRPAASRTSM
jgi:hypothetical protein